MFSLDCALLYLVMSGTIWVTHQIVYGNLHPFLNGNTLIIKTNTRVVFRSERNMNQLRFVCKQACPPEKVWFMNFVTKVLIWRKHTDMLSLKSGTAQGRFPLLPSASGPPVTEQGYFLEAHWQLHFPLRDTCLVSCYSPRSLHNRGLHHLTIFPNFSVNQSLEKVPFSRTTYNKS